MDDRRLLTRSLNEWMPELLRELSFFSREPISIVRDGRHIDLYPGSDVFRVSQSHPGNPLASSFYVDKDRRLLPISCFGLAQPVQLLRHLEPVLRLVEGLDLSAAKTVAVPTVEVQRWFSRNLGHVLDEWFTLVALTMNVSVLSPRTPIYEESPHWDAGLASKFETGAAAIFRGAALNLTTLGGTVHRCSNAAIVRHGTGDHDFLRFHRGVAERAMTASLRLEHGSDDLADFGERVFLTRTVANNPTDAIANLGSLAVLAESEGFTVINPEELRLSQLVIGLRRTSNIVATWGSALALCAFAARGASVLALRTGRYLNEPRDLIWGNLIDEHQLSFNHLDAIAGLIDVDAFRLELRNSFGVGG